MPNKQQTTDYHTGPQRIKDDIELTWGDDDDVKSLWDSAAALLKFTDAADALLFSVDPATGDIVLTGELGGITVLEVGTIRITGADDLIGTTSDPDLLELASGLLTVNGDAQIGNGFLDSQANHFIIKYTEPSGVAIIRIDANPGDGSSTSEFRIARDVTTSGVVQTVGYKGDGTATATWVFNHATGSLQLDGALAVGALAVGNIGTPTNPNQLQFLTAVSAKIEGSLELEGTVPLMRQDNTSDGGTTIGVNMSGFEVSAKEMNATSKFTGAYKFMSSDASFSTDNPKLLGLIVGVATQAYDDDADGGLEMQFCTSPDDVGASSAPVLAMTLTNNQETVLEAPLWITETTTPTARGSYGALYWKSDNGLYGMDGAGVEHVLHLPAFSDMWFFSATQHQVSLTNANEFYQFFGFEHIFEEAPGGLITANPAADEFTVASGGDGCYSIMGKLSMDVSGTNQKVIMAIAIELNTPITIVTATNTTPMVATAPGHNVVPGDMFRIAGGTGMTAINGWWLADNILDDSFNLLFLDGTDSVGNGTYDASSADIITKYPGNAAIPRMFATTDLGAMPLTGSLVLEAGDVVNLVFANVSAGGKTASTSAASLALRRIDADL